MRYKTQRFEIDNTFLENEYATKKSPTDGFNDGPHTLFVGSDPSDSIQTPVVFYQKVIKVGFRDTNYEIRGTVKVLGVHLGHRFNPDTGWDEIEAGRIFDHATRREVVTKLREMGYKGGIEFL